MMKDPQTLIKLHERAVCYCELMAECEDRINGGAIYCKAIKSGKSYLLSANHWVVYAASTAIALYFLGRVVIKGIPKR